MKRNYFREIEEKPEKETRNPKTRPGKCFLVLDLFR